MIGHSSHSSYSDINETEFDTRKSLQNSPVVEEWNASIPRVPSDVDYLQI